MKKLKKLKLCIYKFISALLVMGLITAMPVGFSMQHVYAETGGTSIETSDNQEGTVVLANEDTANSSIKLVDSVQEISSGITYTIENAEQLKHLSELVNAGQTCKGATIQLLNDIDLSAYDDWTPIGGKNAFNGEFYGNSYTISGLKIGQADAANKTLQLVGLFGSIDYDGYIHDVTVETEGIYANYSGEEYSVSVGVLVGLNSGNIVNCITLGNIECRASLDGEVRCGGIIGYNEGHIKESHSEVNVKCGDANLQESFIGGFVGNNIGLIDFCYAIGTVEAGDLIEGKIAMGGLVGWNEGRIVNACATGKITAGDLLGSLELLTGGLIGQNGGFVGNSYATGNVTAGTDSMVGGLIGFHGEGTLFNCYAVGETSGSSEDSTNAFVGVAYMMVDCENLYYNKESKQTLDGIIASTSKDINEVVLAKISDEMKSDDFKILLNKNRESFTFWNDDFAFADWKRSDDRNNGYPEFVGMEVPFTKIEAPSVLTAEVSDVEAKTAKIGGTVTDDGGDSITERGILYSTTEKTPTMEADGVIKVPLGSEKGEFSKKISGLSPITTYYIRAYAVNSADTGYGEVKEFTTKASDGKVTYEISGTVTSNENFVSGANVVLKQGNHEIGQTTTDTNGEYSFAGLTKGVYNLVVTKDEKIVTSLIIIQNADVNKQVKLSADNKNSILLVEGTDTPSVVVGGLDAVAENSEASQVVIKMTVEKKQENEAQNAAEIKKIAKGKHLDFLDMEVIETTAGKDKQLSTLGEVLEIVIPYDFTGKSNVNVYRYHETDVNTFEKLGTKPTSTYSDGTYYLDETNGLIYVYTKKFSTYAIGYQTETHRSSGGGSSYSYYNITVNQTDEGSISPNTISVRENSDKTFTIKAKEGYMISDVLIDGKSVGAVNKYTFENVKKAHTIKAVFKEVSKENPFTDINEKDWFYDEVLKVFEKEIMAGTSDTKFSPYIGTSRAMIATIIHRMENKPNYMESNPFNDVLEDKWYTDGITWCAEHKIVKGYGEGIFKPDQIVTREELCAILYRYAQYKGLDVTQKAQLSSFVDESEVGNWAKESVSYAVKAKMVKGNDHNQLQPKKQATRAEVATVVLNLSELIKP